MKHQTISLSTKGKTDIINITDEVVKIVGDSNIEDGIICIFCSGSTGGITTMEYEPGAVKDLKEFFNKNIPYNKSYYHHETWGCDNGASHLRASLIGPSLSIPIIDRKLVLGTWQQIVFIDFDTRARKRELICQFY